MISECKERVLSFAAYAASFVIGLCAAGCESDHGSDDGGYYGTTNVERDITSDRDLDRNTGGQDGTTNVDPARDSGDSETMNTDDDWLRGGSGGVGGNDDTGGGTGQP